MSKSMKRVIIIQSAVVLAILVAVWWLFFGSNGPAAPEQNAAAPEFIASTSYDCAGGKTIKADFYKGANIPVKPGEPPVPTGSVNLVLSDGRDMTLPQTISADGGRYANKDESFIFWSKSNTAFIMENGTTTFQNCLVVQK